jgi:hypothetical protein
MRTWINYELRITGAGLPCPSNYELRDGVQLRITNYGAGGPCPNYELQDGVQLQITGDGRITNPGGGDACPDSGTVAGNGLRRRGCLSGFRDGGR